MKSHHGDSSRKRKTRHFDEEAWDCTVCTFRNSPEEFRCEICQTRKGTSTRKPTLNRQIVEEQSLIARAIIKEKEDESLRRKREYRTANRSTLSQGSLSSLKNIDRSSPLLFEIFANGYSVVITEYRTTSTEKSSFSVPDSPALSNASSLLGCTSTPLGASSDQLSPIEQHSAPVVSMRTNHFSEFQDGNDFHTVVSDQHTADGIESFDVSDLKSCGLVKSKTENTKIRQSNSSCLERKLLSKNLSSILKTDSSPGIDEAYRDSSSSDYLLNVNNDLRPIIQTISNQVSNNGNHLTPKKPLSSFRVSKRRLKQRILSTSISSSTSDSVSNTQRWSTSAKSRRHFSTPKSLRLAPLSRLCSSRSLRSQICSKTRQASKVAHASLFQNTDQMRPRSRKRRRVVTSCSRRSLPNTKKLQVGENSSLNLTPKPLSSVKFFSIKSESSISPENNHEAISFECSSEVCEQTSSAQMIGDNISIKSHIQASAESKTSKMISNGCRSLSI